MGNNLIVSFLAFWKCIQKSKPKPILDKKIEKWIKQHKHEEKTNYVFD